METNQTYQKLWNDLESFNDMIEHFRIFVKDLKEIKSKDKLTLDATLKKSKLSVEKLQLSPYKRQEYLNEAANNVENLFLILKKSKRLVNIELMLIDIFKNYCKLLNEKIYIISLENYSNNNNENSNNLYPKI